MEIRAEDAAVNQLSLLDEEWATKLQNAEKDAKSLGDAKNLHQAFMAYFARQLNAPGNGAGGGAKKGGVAGKGKGKSAK